MANTSMQHSMSNFKTEADENAKALDREDVLRLLCNPNSKMENILELLAEQNFYSSSKPLSGLKQTMLHELAVNVRDEESYVLLRCLGANLDKAQRITLFAEDGNNDSTICLIYNHVHMTRSQKANDEFPVGTSFLVKEPCLRQCANGNNALVVYSPSDIVRVTNTHRLFEEIESLGWTNGADDPVSADGWKQKGDAAFSQGIFHSAINAYLMGLKLESEGTLSLNTLLNLASSYFTLGFYEPCLDQLSKVFQREPENEKALFQAGQCFYKLRQFDKSLNYFQQLSHVNPSHPKVKNNIELCEKRLTEQNGFVDVYKMFQTRVESSLLDFGNYVGPLEIVPVPGKGRGVIATEDLKAGKLVLAEKAFSATMTKDSSERFGMIHTSFGDILAETVNLLYKNPKAYSKVFHLTSNKSDTVGNNDNQSFDDEDFLVDVDKILRIITINSFVIRSRSSGEKHSLLFYFCSYINHSCVPNCSMTTYNDVTLVRTLTHIKKGQELTIAYHVDMEPRLHEMAFRGFKCDCAYCELERKDPLEVKKKRVELSRMAKLFNDKGRNLEIIKNLEETYKGRNKYTTALFNPYLLLAHSFVFGMQQCESKFMFYVDKALSCLGLSSDILLRCAEDENEHFPPSAMLTDEDPLFEVAMTVLWHQTCREDMTKWFKVLLMLERVFSGGDIRMLIEKYPQAAEYMDRVNL